MECHLSANLRLLLLRPEDASGLFSLVEANRTYLRQWLPWLDHNTSPADSLSFIKNMLEQHSLGKGFGCGVFLHEELVGTCGFNEIDQKNQTGFIGYWLAQDEQGQGLMTRCTQHLIKHAFSELGLRQIHIRAAVGNTQSRAICERLGFSQIAILPKAEDLYGTWVDHCDYALSHADWAKKQKGNA